MRPIHFDRKGGVPIYRQIAAQIRDAIAKGELSENERLPTTRALAGRLGVNRITVARAYAELSAGGQIASRVGRGTWVLEPARSEPLPSPLSGARVSWGSILARAADRAAEWSGESQVATRDGDGIVSFASIFPDPTLFPIEALRRAIDDVLSEQGHEILGYSPPGGHAPLRRMIAEDLRRQGMDVVEEEIVITSGSQQGIDLVARALLNPGDLVMVEEPTYTGAAQVFHSYGAELAGVPVDEDGAAVHLLEQAVAVQRPKLIYLMPNFQNPTSRTMSLARRRALIDLAASRGLAVLEDDFGGDLRFEGAELPSLKAMDPGGSVIYLSTFAKKLLPGLRVGWLAAPRDLAERLVGLKRITDYGTSPLLQAALLRFCERGDLDRHLSHVVAKYRERRDAMLQAMSRWFPKRTSWTRPQGGLLVWVTLPEGVDAEEVAREAESHGVLVGRGDLFYVNGGTGRNLRLTFSQASPLEIHRGIRLLGEIIRRRTKTRQEAGRRSSPEPLPLI